MKKSQYIEILAVVDAFDAMVGGRSYSDILSLQGAKELENNAGTQFDPEIVAALSTYFSNEEKRLLTQYRIVEKRNPIKCPWKH